MFLTGDIVTSKGLIISVTLYRNHGDVICQNMSKFDSSLPILRQCMTIRKLVFICKAFSFSREPSVNSRIHNWGREKIFVCLSRQNLNEDVVMS